MINRRNLLSAGFAATTLTGLSGVLPKAVWSSTVGSADPKTWANVSDVNIFANAWKARFTNVLPNALDPSLLGIGFIYRPDGGTKDTYTVTAGETLWGVLGPVSSGLPLTPVWGYGNFEGVANSLAVTFPGRSFVVRRGATIHVNWVNNLAETAYSGGAPQRDATGNLVTDGAKPLPHLFGIDQSVSMQNDQTAFNVDKATGAVIYSGNDIVGVPMAVHHHGGDSKKEFDGGPDHWTSPRKVQAGPGVIPGTNTSGEALAYTYDNAQEASIHWYHDHAEGVTRINAYAGLAGLYVVRDANEDQLVARNLIPSGAYEVPLVLQDKCFTENGSLAYSSDANDYPAPIEGLQSPTAMPEVFGDIIVVSGVAWPHFDVEPREYRLRLLNASDSRFFNLRFGFGGVARRGGFNEYLEIYKISTDLGFLNAPVQMPRQSVLIAPGERMDVVVDFGKVRAATTRAERTVVVTNDGATPYPLGAPTVPGTMGPGTVMQFNVRLPLNAAVAQTRVAALAGNLVLRGRDPGTPNLPVPARVPAGTKVRRILLAEGSDEFGRIMPQLGSFQLPGDEPYANYPGEFNLGTMAYSQRPTETPRVGTTEVWEMWNSSVDAHPLHMHLVQFRILNREAFGPTASAPIDPETGVQVMSEAKDMVNSWSGSRLIPQWVQLSGAVTNAPPHEQGWKDTVICYPGEVTRVLVSFTRPGKYVMHCHILSHEEHDMMRWYEVV